MTLGATRSVKLGRGKWAIRGATTLSKLEGPVSWSGVLLPFSRKKLERYTQFGAVCYPQQTPTKKLRKKSGAVQFFRGVRIPPAPVVASMGTMCGPDDGVAEGDLGAEH